eukprot:403347289
MHKVKGIGMSNFTDKEAATIAEKGNKNVQETLMGDYSQKLYPEPDKRDLIKMKEFFKLKYTQKRFEKKSDNSDSDDDSDDDKKKKSKKTSSKSTKDSKNDKKKSKKRKDSSSEESESDSDGESKKKKPKKEEEKATGKFLPAPGGKKLAAPISSNTSSNGRQQEQIKTQIVNSNPPSKTNSTTVDLLDILSEQPPTQAPQNFNQHGNVQQQNQAVDNNGWSTWATFDNNNGQQQTQQPVVNQQSRNQQESLIQNLSNLYPNQTQPPITKTNFIPAGLTKPNFVSEDPFQDIIQEQQHQQWLHKQQQALAQNQQQQQQHHVQPAQQQQQFANPATMHQQLPGMGGFGSGVPQQQQQQPQPNPQAMQQQQQLMSMQAQMAQLMQQSQTNPNQQTIAMMAQMQQMIMMMQNMMSSSMGGGAAPGGQPGINAQQLQQLKLQQEQQEQMKKHNPQDNMFSDLFKSAASQPLHQGKDMHHHDNGSQFNPFGSNSNMSLGGNTGGPQMQPMSGFNNNGMHQQANVQQQSSFNPFGNAGPSMSSQTSASSNNPFDMF